MTAVGDARKRLDRAAAAKALRAQAEEFRTTAATAWGGDFSWLTSGNKVAELAAEWCEESAARIESGDQP